MVPGDEEAAIRLKEGCEDLLRALPDRVPPRIAQAAPAKAPCAVSPLLLPAFDQYLEKLLHLEIGEEGHEVVGRFLDDHARTPVTKRSAMLSLPDHSWSSGISGPRRTIA